MGKFHKGCFGTLILRFVIGGAFLNHGIMKLMSPSGAMMDFVGSAATNIGMTFFTTTTWFWIAAVAETVGAILLILGLGTRFGAFVLALLMIFAINMKGWGFATSELEYILLGACVSLLFMGGKRYSLDAALTAGRNDMSRL